MDVYRSLPPLEDILPDNTYSFYSWADHTVLTDDGRPVKNVLLHISHVTGDWRVLTPDHSLPILKMCPGCEFLHDSCGQAHCHTMDDAPFKP